MAVVAYVLLAAAVPDAGLGGLLDPSDALRQRARRALLAAADPQQAVAAAREALAADPAAPHHWADYGDALLAAASPQRAARAYRTAVDRGPGSAAVLRRAIHFHFAVDQTDVALELSRRLLALQPDADLFPLWERMDVTPAEAFAAGLPDLAARRAYVARLVDAASPGLDEAWDLLAAEDAAGADLLRRYVAQLLADDRFDRAARVRAAVGGCEDAPSGPSSDSILRDGGFECPLGPTRLDWRVTAHPHVQVERVDDPVHSGHGALRLDLDGQGDPLFYHVAQQVPVQPGRWYRARAWIRTRNVTSEEGVGLWIADPRDSHRLSVATPTARGSTPWTLYQKVFRAPPQTRLIEVRIFRRPSGAPGARLAGVAWVDDVSLAAVR